MISQKMQDAFNEQIQAEMFSSNLYLAMAACFEDANLKGSAHWMKLQAREELGHAMKIFEYVIERGGRAKVPALDAPQEKWPGALEAFQAAYDHERHITERIEKLAAVAEQEKDRAAGIFLQWFIEEQVEEEANADEIVQTLKMIGDSANGLIMLDRSLAKRE